MEKITLLTKEQVETLKVLKKYGMGAEATDLYTIQKGWSSYNKGEYLTRTKIPNTTPYVFRITAGSCIGEWDIMERSGVRPILSLSNIYEFRQNIKSKIINGIKEIEYGEYPQSVVDEDLEIELENLYQQNNLNKTNKKYTFIQENENKVYEEYSHKENKYIRINDTLINGMNYKFTNGRDAIGNKTYWVKVEPIKWLVDEKENIAISKYIIANMNFSYKNNDYDTSVIKEYLEKYFIKEIISKKKRQEKINKNNIDINKINDLIDMMNVLNDKEEKAKQKVR